MEAISETCKNVFPVKSIAPESNTFPAAALKYYVLGRRTHFLINGIVTVTNKRISLQIALGGILVHLFKADVKRPVFPSLFITADLNGTVVVVVIIKADLKGILVHIVIYCYASIFFQLIKSSRI